MRLLSLVSACGILLAVAACGSSSSDSGGGELDNEENVRRFFEAVVPELVEVFTEVGNELSFVASLSKQGGSSVPCPDGGSIEVNTETGAATATDCSARGVTFSANLALLVFSSAPLSYVANFNGFLDVSGTFTGRIDVIQAEILWMDPATVDNTCWNVTVLLGGFPVTVAGGTCPGAGQCAELFGFTPDATLCGETADSCKFYVLLNDRTCDAWCAIYGSSCLGSISDVEDTCVEGEPGQCFDAVGDRICVCTKF